MLFKEVFCQINQVVLYINKHLKGAIKMMIDQLLEQKDLTSTEKSIAD